MLLTNASFVVTIAEGAAPLGGVQLWEGGPYWAECNVGATTPEEYGYYFWWGDTVGYKREGDAWVASDGSSENFSFDKDNTPTYDTDDATLQSEGWITAEGVLAPEHDAAQVQWGGGWRMPTDSELSALIDNCEWTSTATNGVNGYMVHGRGDFAEASIFLPAAGYGYGDSLSYDGFYGNFWSIVPHTSIYYSPETHNHYDALYLDFACFGWGTLQYVDNVDRHRGYSIRPIRGATE